MRGSSESAVSERPQGWDAVRPSFTSQTKGLLDKRWIFFSRARMTDHEFNCVNLTDCVQIFMWAVSRQSQGPACSKCIRMYHFRQGGINGWRLLQNFQLKANASLSPFYLLASDIGMQNSFR